MTPLEATTHLLGDTKTAEILADPDAGTTAALVAALVSIADDTPPEVRSAIGAGLYEAAITDSPASR